jgi:hypothetical protein
MMQIERTSKTGKPSDDLSGDQNEQTVIPIAMVMQAETSSQKARLFSIESFFCTAGNNCGQLESAFLNMMAQ